MLSILFVILLLVPTYAFDYNQIIDISETRYIEKRESIYYYYEYEGLQRVIENKKSDLLQNIYNQALESYVDNSHEELIDINIKLRYYSQEQPIYKWWEQSWLDLLKNNSSHEVIILGNSRKLINNSVFSLTNEGGLKFNLLDIDFFNSDDNLDVEPVAPNQRILRANRNSVGIRLPQGNIYCDNRLSVSSIFKIGLRFNQLSRNRSYIRVGAKCTYYLHKKPIIELTLIVFSRPMVNRSGFQFTLEFLSF